MIFLILIGSGVIFGLAYTENERRNNPIPEAEIRDNKIYPNKPILIHFDKTGEEIYVNWWSPQPNEKKIKIETQDGKKLTLIKKYCTSESVSGMMGGRPEITVIRYKEDPNKLFEEAKENAMKRKLKSASIEIEKVSKSTDSIIYGHAKTRKALGSLHSPNPYGYGYGGYSDGYYGGAIPYNSGRPTPSEDVRRRDEMDGGERE